MHFVEVDLVVSMMPAAGETAAIFEALALGGTTFPLLELRPARTARTGPENPTP